MIYENRKKKRFSFCILLAYLYLCRRMRKMLLTLTLLVLATACIFADDERQDDSKNVESKRRIDHICELYNSDMNDSLILLAPIDMKFHKKERCWEHYYETWMHLVNTYVFMGKVNTGLQEVKKMHHDATERLDKYGQALAYYAMGNAYQNMGYLDESIKCYQQSLELIHSQKMETTIENDIYSYYCDALNVQKRYMDMTPITRQWHEFLQKLTKNEKSQTQKQRSNIWWAYYYLACAQQDLGLGHLDKAEENINEAEKHHTDPSEFIPMSILYYRAQLWMQRKDYEKAREYNDLRMERSRNYDDKSSAVLIFEQRAKIMTGLGNYKEAADMYRDVYELTDSIYKKESRTQINELNTLFHVTETEMVKRLERNRYVMIIAGIVLLALTVFLSYSWWMNRRLKRKNEELAVARDQAQESLRMKSAFIKNISHEIRTPLNILSGFSQVLAQADVELPVEIRQEASTNIQENTNRITSLINRLLALSESSSRSKIEAHDTISILQLCQTAISASGVADNSTHTFSFEAPGISEKETIQTSEQYTIQAICHLLDNAMKFTPAGGSIRMLCEAGDNLVTISIEDTGCGVPKEKANDIFAEFVQLDEFKTGVGIGLTLSRNIARRLGGDLVLDTSYTHGARFVLTLKGAVLNRAEA